MLSQTCLIDKYCSRQTAPAPDLKVMEIVWEVQGKKANHLNVYTAVFDMFEGRRGRRDGWNYTNSLSSRSVHGDQIV